MKKILITPFVFAAFIYGPSAGAQTNSIGNAQRGQALYAQQCMACHAVDSNKVGPAHRGVLNRRAGSLVGYTYSEELAASKVIWTAKTLDNWLADPEKLIPGQRMGFAVKSKKQRADLIAYLTTLK